MARLLEDPQELESDGVLIISIVKGKSKRMIEKSFDKPNSERHETTR